MGNKNNILKNVIFVLSFGAVKKIRHAFRKTREGRGTSLRTFKKGTETRSGNEIL